ncbi:MAG TPA: hypothetical protein VFG69_04705 [Nannocystaceae bacterium]|nr:hypothetical protein [Nannocystaceae bacterium]
MSDLFTIHCLPKTTATGARASASLELADDRVMLMREPKVGESLVIVAEGAGLVYTSPVRGYLQVARGWVVETANHMYTFTALSVGTPTLADAA